MQTVYAHRYHSYELNNLVTLLNSQGEMGSKINIAKIKNDRKVHGSCAAFQNKKDLTDRSSFNNKTRQGGLFETKTKSVPYFFIPKYKNETFILPDRAFQKGLRAKRFVIKMKDSSVQSFKDMESSEAKALLRRSQKDEIINGRKMEELNRILDEEDGSVKAKCFKNHLKARKIFRPSKNTSELFSVVDPILGPKDQQFLEIRKTKLSKTFGPTMWRPTSRGKSFNSTIGRNTTFSKTSSVFETGSYA